MGLVSWIKNLFSSKEEGARGVNGIKPVSDGEPLNAITLNRPSFIIGGRLDHLNKELETIINNLTSRRIIIECMARNWTGHAYIDEQSGSIALASGAIAIPDNTAMTIKLIDEADERSPIITGSIINIGINDGVNKGKISIYSKNTSQYDSSRPKMLYSGDLTIKFVSSTGLSVSQVEEDGVIKYFQINYIEGITTLQEVVNAINALASDYIGATLIESGITIVSGLNNKIISASDTYYDALKFDEAYSNLTSGYIIRTRKYVKSLEFDIPASVLKSFFSDIDMYLKRGEVLAVRLPMSNIIPDGSKHQLEIRKASVTSRILISSSDLVKLSASDPTISKQDGLYIPIAKASNPALSTINNYAKESFDQIQSLSYVDFADGIRVYSGQIYYEFNVGVKTAVSDSSTSIIDIDSNSIPNNINVFANLSINPWDYNGLAEAVLCIFHLGSGTYSDFVKEGKEFILKRDLQNNTTHILFTSETVRNTFKTTPGSIRLIVYTPVSTAPGGGKYPANSYPLPFDFTHDSGFSIFKNGREEMITGELGEATRKLGLAIQNHLSNLPGYYHSDGSITEPMIANGAITHLKISSTNNNWAFKGSFLKDGTGLAVFKDETYGKLGSITNGDLSSQDIEQAKNIITYARSIDVEVAPAKMGGASTASLPYRLYYNLVCKLVDMPFALNSADLFKICYINGNIIPLDINTDPKKMLGIPVSHVSNFPLSMYTTVCTEGVCLVRSESGISVGDYLTLSSTNAGFVTTLTTESLYLGIALSNSSDDGSGNYYVVAYLFSSPRY